MTPYFKLPAHYFSEDATDEHKAIIAVYKEVLERLSKAKQSGVVIPACMKPEWL